MEDRIDGAIDGVLAEKEIFRKRGANFPALLVVSEFLVAKESSE